MLIFLSPWQQGAGDFREQTGAAYFAYVSQADRGKIQCPVISINEVSCGSYHTDFLREGTVHGLAGSSPALARISHEHCVKSVDDQVFGCAIPGKLLIVIKTPASVDEAFHVSDVSLSLFKHTFQALKKRVSGSQ